MLHHWLHRHGFNAGKVMLFLFSSNHMYCGVKVKVPCLLNLGIAWMLYLISSTLVSSPPAAFLSFVVLQDIGCFHILTHLLFSWYFICTGEKFAVHSVQKLMRVPIEHWIRDFGPNRRKSWMCSLRPRFAVFEADVYEQQHATRKKGRPGASLAYSATETDTQTYRGIDK